MIPFVPILPNLVPPGATAPPGCPSEPLVLGFRQVAPDLRSSNGHRDPWPGGWCLPVDDGRDWSPDAAPDEPCPSHELGGYCVAHSWRGAKSCGHPAHTVLLVAYRSADLLGGGWDHAEQKVRVAARVTLDVIDVPALIRVGHYRFADLRYADLRSANLRSANLRSAYLGYADLRSAYLGSANLRSAYLGYADLGSAYLGYADLRSANLGYAYLGYADLGSANLGSADLRSAYLGYANLGSANLGYADLRSADLRGARANERTLWPAGFDPDAAGVERWAKGAG